MYTEDNFMSVLIENRENNIKYKARLSFEFNNCHFETTPGSSIDVMVPPLSDRILKIVKNKGAYSFGAKLASFSDNIK